MTTYDLAKKWAPINYQYIRLDDDDQSYQTKKDLLCSVNFDSYPNVGADSNWDTNDIKKRLTDTQIENLTPVCYYAVSETDTHYFILYSFYHADDDTHINDMEGCLVILEKTGNDQVLLGMVTVAHLDFFAYTYQDNLLKKSGEKFSKSEHIETDDELEGAHPLIQQEEGKHGLYALGTKINFGTKIIRWFLGLLNLQPDVIVYYPGEETIQYSPNRLRKGRGTPYDPSFYYVLVDIFDQNNGLWQKWKSRPNKTFQANGKFYGDKANPPWLWRPGLEKGSNTPEIGLMWKNPSELATELFRPAPGRKEFSDQYLIRWPVE